MKMKQVFNLSFAPQYPATETAQARSELIIDQQPCGIVIPGSVLEAAVEINAGRFVLFVTDGISYEESLSIVLYQRGEGVQEIIHIENAYSSGFFEQFAIHQDHIEFKFLGGARWSLEVADAPKFALPFIGDPQFVKRSPGFKKQLLITSHEKRAG
ncbi:MULTISPECIES: hypothetical protein [unclassified Pantoea]|uniref:hypothetical protein n=1 Tax=unclassified Pantoea TaxID=2630326 RepID=UPI001CD33901|nr:MULTISPECIES: hypothetical protein [unclassified Pantoea]MCA1175804.1 hypothetical protein [Pantoea sp. alder69]MCA1250636.1 hypothetical protein [Pantoea sp. alder70]MCA1265150.1 hypothetical protein [Pantoea sp. alder81]